MATKASRRASKGKGSDISKAPDTPKASKIPKGSDMAQSSDTSNGGEEDADFPNLTNLDPFEVVQTPHLRQVLELNQKFKDMFREFNQFVEANPINPNPTTPAEKEKEQHVEIEIQRKRKRIIAQLSLLKGAHRRAVMKTREEKEKTAKAKQENDGLVLQLHNLKYEQESLQKEIYAADNYDHKYTKLPLIPAEEFLAQFSEYEDKSESELMEARIDHEHRERVKLEEQRQEKLKIKQQLIAEVKRRKEDLGKLDESLEKFIDAALPIETALANEYPEDTLNVAECPEIEQLYVQIAKVSNLGAGNPHAEYIRKRAVSYGRLMVDDVADKATDAPTFVELARVAINGFQRALSEPHVKPLNG